jgi:uncharacterized protein YkwD
VTLASAAPWRPFSLSGRRTLALALAALVVASSAVVAQPTPVAAATASDMESLILKEMNDDRAARGLVRYRAWGALADLAASRAQRMADSGTLSHDAAGGDVGNALTGAGIQWYSYGETIGQSGYAWGSDAALSIYKLWKGSAPHAAIMFSSSYNYVGIGVVQGSDGSAWISAVFAESVDHTAPVAKNRKLYRVGRDTRFRWSGHDRRLQTHTAGLRSFDVQMKRDNGTWRTIRDDTTATKLVLRHRARGHWYSFRVQAKDRRGTLSSWTTVKRIWVP